MSITLYDKLWKKHVIAGDAGELQLLYIDMHYIHEVTSPQAFSGLEISNRTVRCPQRTFATMDHNTPTIKKDRFNVTDELSKIQLTTLEDNCNKYGIDLANMFDDRNGIVHVIGPELGITQPGMTIVCGDSHTATHGAFGALAFGIGTSEVEHVFATQTLWQKKLKNLGIKVTGELSHRVYAKDIILYILSKYGVSVGSGYAIEFFGETIEKMSMDERMTLCNMSIEAGAKVGLVKPDEVTFEYVKEQLKKNNKDISTARISDWCSLYTDDESAFDKIIHIDATKIKPQVTWGTNPGMGIAIDENLPHIIDDNYKKAYDYMGLTPNDKITEIPIKHVFIGSCTNSRYSDLEIVAEIVKGKKVNENVSAVIVPGSKMAMKEAEANGLDKIFLDAGFEWREPGCSSCLGMNPDLIPEYEHCASTSNRNFEGRQGKNSRTHLVSPAMAAATAIVGHFVDIRNENWHEEAK